MANPVVILDYNPRWPVLYEEEKNTIIGVIGQKVVEIEHIGSTAVPGLGAKPIIDIMVGVRWLADANECIKPLQSIGYEYVPKYETDMPERRYFQKGPVNAHRHLHMVEVTSDFWERLLLFRDFLRAHPDVARQYLTLKKELAVKYNTERERYTESKTYFIERIVDRARAENKTKIRG